MSVSATAISAPSELARPSDSVDALIRTGLVVVGLFFGGFGVWAATAPLNAAVVGDAVVKVEGNRKSVQHLDGGTVREIRVKDGDRVTADDILIVLDDTVPRAEFDILAQQHAQLVATEIRLKAELDGVSELNTVVDDRVDPLLAAAISEQAAEFRSRRDAQAGRRAVLEKRINQYDAQINGLNAQRGPLKTQLASLSAERSSLEELLKSGLTTRARVLDLERQETSVAAQLGELESNIEIAGETIAELNQQILQLETDRSAEVNAELREVRIRLADVAPRLEASRVGLERTSVRAPYSGTVVDLAVFSVGAVIGRGERLLDIVPEETKLDVEARIRVEDISDIRPGMKAEVHFTSYKQRVTPIIHGVVEDLSADRLVDERTQLPYYVAQVSIDQAELAASPEIELYPGMPATVMITTIERSALDYLVGPLFASLNQSFRER